MSIFKFLNPHEKTKKYAKELKDKCRLTNDGKKKKEPLTVSQAAYRLGYLQARKDATALWKANQEKAAVASASKKKNIKRKELDKYELENSKKNPMEGMDIL